MRPYFVADAATVTVMRPLASSAFGRIGFTLPKGVEISDLYKLSADGNEVGYVAHLSDRRVGGIARRFVRADVSITTVDDGGSVNASSDVDAVLTDAKERVASDFFLESDISRAGLGVWREFVDFTVGDMVDVEIWGRVVTLPVTRIEPVVSDFADDDVRVHVGGQLVDDERARLVENAAIYRAVLADRKELLGLSDSVKSAQSTASAAQSTAATAQSTAATAQSVAGEAKAAAVEARSQADFALASANGKSTNFYGESEPASARDGDTWFKSTPKGIVLFQRVNGVWVEAVAPVDFTGVDAQLEQNRADVAAAMQDVAAAQAEVDAVQALVAQKVDISVYASKMTELDSALSSQSLDLARKINRGDVQASDIVAGAVVAGKLAAGAVATDNLQAGSVTSKEIAAGSITADKLLVRGGGDYSPNPTFNPSAPLLGTPHSWIPGNGGHSVQLTGRHNTFPASTAFPVAKGDVFYITCEAAHPSGSAPLFLGLCWTVNPSTATSIGSYSNVQRATDLGQSANNPDWHTYAATITVPTASDAVVTAAQGYIMMDVDLPGQETSAQNTWLIGNYHIFKVSDGTLIADGSITTNKLVANAVTTDKIAAGAVTAREIKAGTITGNEIKAGSVTSDKLVIENGFIKTAMIGDGQIDTAKISDAAITNAKIANLDAGKITTGFLDAGRIAAGSITASHLRVEPGNLFPDPHFKDPSWPWNSNVQTGPTHGGELVFRANGTHNSAYFVPEGKWLASVTLVPGAEYTLTAGRYADNEQTRRLSVRAGYKKSDGSEGWVWLGDLTTPGLGVYTTTMRFKAPEDMVGGLCSIGFALEPDQTAGMASIWNVNLVRAADASLIVNGAIKAEHLEAGSITASKVNADEIFLKAHGDISLQEQWDDFGVQLDSVQSSIGFISRLATRADSTRRGIGLAMHNSVLGSTETKSLFTVNGGTVTATGAWKGRFILLGPGMSVGNLDPRYVELSGTDNRSSTFTGPHDIGAIILWERDPVVESTTTIKPIETWDAPQNAWTTIPGMSTTLAGGATSVSVNGKVYFTNVNRGSTYGVRVLIGGNVVWSWQSNTFGPLTFLGNPTWSAPVRFERDVSGGQSLQVQVLCGDANGYKRRVTTATQVDVTSYIQV